MTSSSDSLFTYLLISFSAIIEDARHPQKYRLLVGSVDVVFADVAQPDQARIVALNSHHFLKDGGHALISIKASCIDSTAVPEAVFAAEVKKLQSEVSKSSLSISSYLSSAMKNSTDPFSSFFLTISDVPST